MKQIFGYITLLLALTALAPQLLHADYVPREAQFSYVYLSPQFDFYDSAYGFEIQANKWKWKDETVGWAYSMGLHNWDINARPSQITAVREITSVRGSASFIMGGLSFIYRPVVTERFRLSCDLGSRIYYGLTSATANVPLGNGDSTRGGGIDIASQITGVATINGQFQLNSDWRIAAGVGYQADIVQGKISFANQTIADNELATPIVRIGVLIDY
jgi:hypothetical protein